MTEALPQVSVIVATYNVAPFVESCLRSILDQRAVTLEVLVIDDVSRDETVAIARRIAEADPRVRIVERERNAGPAAARNAGLEIARGQWIAIVDSDDLLHPNRFARLIAAAQDTGADMVADDLLVFDDASAASPRRFLAPADHGEPFELRLDEYLRRSVLYGGEPNPGFLKPVIRRSALAAAGVRYDETLRIAEDDDLAIRLLLAGLTYVVVPVPWYFYRKHGRSISHRLTLSAIEAMRDADRSLGSRISTLCPDLSSQCAMRQAAFERAVSFEAMIAALKAGQPLRALAHLARKPSILPMLRMPLAGAVHKLVPQRAGAAVDAAEQARILARTAEAVGA